MKRFRNIGLLILLLLAGRMAAQVPVLDSVCSGAVRHYRVDGEAGSTYSWILTPPSGPVVTLPSDADTLEMYWNYPAGVYELVCTQHALNGCDAEAVYGQVIITGQPDVDAGPDDLVCVGRYYKLIYATAANYSSLLWQTSGDGTFDDSTYLNATYTPGANDILAETVTLTLTGYGILEDGGCEPSVSTLELSIVYEIVPLFEPIGPLCQYSTPPALPDTSLQGMTGNWVPPIINTDFLGTFPYIFSPDDPAQCGIDTTILITITNGIIPQFEPIGPLCIFSTPPALPDTSLEGITGTWVPPTISTGVPGNFTYTFTPGDPSQCALETTMDIAVVTEINPLFDPIGPLCQYSTPVPLPGTSTNGIAGTWVPPIPDTDVPGTFTFVFTPYPDQCGIDTTIEITVLPQVIPEFDPVGPLCQYSAAPALPGISLNGITGTWDPAWISTDTPGLFTYTFTPGSDQCGAVITMDIIVMPELTPEFEPIGQLCQFSTPPVLPDTSLNGIPGSWYPPVITTGVTGTLTYTFTPVDTIPCVLPLSIAVVVVSEILPVFDTIGPLCQYSTPPALPDTSINGITGTWMPATISTGTPGTSTYIFTPGDPSQCAIGTSIDISVVTEIAPVFDPVGPLCQNSTPIVLPGTSLNGITGTWYPPAISTDIPGTFTFTFTPGLGQCGIETSLDVTVIPEVTPAFEPIAPLCQYSTAPSLPDTSLNSITGTWNPPITTTDEPGTFIHTFTPDTGQCAVETVIEFVVNAQPLVTQVIITNTYCGEAEGQLLIIANSPSGSGLLYSINNGLNYSALNTFDNLQAGNYNIRVRDNNGCEAVYTGNPVVLEDTPGPQVLGTIVTGETDGLQNGAIEIIATGNTPQLFYSINNGASWQTNNGLFENLSAGTYPCIVQDENGCDTSFFIQINNIFLTPLEAITTPGGHCMGNAAIVPVEVDEFHSVAEFQLKLSYNVDYLLCEGYVNIHPQLANKLTGWIDQVAGVITLQWQDTAPLTFMQKETVVELVFTPTQTGQGQLDWYTGATESYFRTQDGTPIPVEFYANDVDIYNPPEILLAANKTACEGESVKILGMASTTYPPLRYSWTYPDGHTDTIDPVIPALTQSDAGDYTLLVTDAMGCTDQKTIRLVVSENPVAAFHGTDTLTVPFDYLLEAGTGMASYLWNTGETSESLRIRLEGMYRVELVSMAGCVGVDSVYILVLTDELPEECIFIPNAFTPDGDGLNDTFKAVTGCPVSFFRMEIFDRWGELMFVSKDISIGWDGFYDGKLCPGDGYVYKIVYRPEGLEENAENMVKVGMVVIVK